MIFGKCRTRPQPAWRPPAWCSRTRHPLRRRRLKLFQQVVEQDQDEDADDEEDEDEDEDSQFDNEENDKITIPKEIKKIVVEESEIVDELETPKSEEKKEYKNLNLSELKQLVISKGLATNTGKMRKNDLISLLEENDKNSDDENL